MAKIKAADLVAKFRQAYAERWGYIYGTRGQTWTQAQQDKATRDMTVRYGQQWVGRRVADCSGLAAWAFRELGGSIYHGSNTIFNKHCSQTGPLVGEVQIKPGMAVFQNKDGRRPHIGYYDGSGMCIEEQGTRTGIVRSPLASWDEWGMLADVDYDALPWELHEVTTPQTTREGDAGELVEYIQLALIEAGFDELTPDGHFGVRTKAAVIAFQESRGLEADGVVGPATWAALRGIFEDDEPDEDVSDDEPKEPTLPMDPPPAEIRRTLRSGSKGDDVRTLQRTLRSLGYTLEIDGKFGPITVQCVKSFQGTAGLSRDGVVGPMTWAALDAAASGGRYTVIIHDLLESVATDLTNQYGGEMVPEGGEDNV